ncbi:Maf-like protein [Bartonella sp. HY329]|uniref:Maf-like protein n=1 Tax=unclassified Bartonella TaxID=2645622 RepID=UPI0021C910F7|nr:MULTISPECIES: Maf-like protein [unclassified Bartonella]UXM95259.1 Maf-like protein [Bartonella sp. HY329]UXN09583.1 Maf-like protein [Bartonella sp. HY328]
MTDNLILASLSPFRAGLLKNAGLSIAIEGAQLDERVVERDIGAVSPKKLAEILSLAKACDVSKRFPNALVIGCDQTLELDGDVIHKPKDMEEARRRLMAMSGKVHHLHSGIVLVKNQEIIWSSVETANMHVRILEPSFIGYYLERVGNKVLSSVGAYQIEGEGIQLFDKIDGDYFTIIGLPLIPLLNKLRQLGIINA